MAYAQTAAMGACYNHYLLCKGVLAGLYRTTGPLVVEWVVDMVRFVGWNLYFLLEIVVILYKSNNFLFH